MRSLEARTLLVLFFYLSAPVASADPVAIVNAGFEEPVMPPGDYTYYVDPPGWTFIGTTRRAVWNVSAGWDAWFPYGAPEGNQIGALWEGSFVQTLGVALAPNTTYTLQAEYMHVPDRVSEFTLELLAGGVSLGSTGGLLPPLVDGTFYPAEVVVTTGATPAHQGESLVIRISSTATEAEFDNIRLDATSTITTQVVAIDIKPGSNPNSVNLCSNGALPVAILGTNSFDVYDVNTDTLRFADASVKVVGKKDPHSLCSVQDVSGDLIDDVVCHYVTADIAAIDGESTTATVNGELLDGTLIEGSDSINIVKDTCN
jgi:hypothetical protein